MQRLLLAHKIIISRVWRANMRVGDWTRACTAVFLSTISTPFSIVSFKLTDLQGTLMLIVSRELSCGKVDLLGTPSQIC